MIFHILYLLYQNVFSLKGGFFSKKWHRIIYLLDVEEKKTMLDFWITVERLILLHKEGLHSLIHYIGSFVASKFPNADDNSATAFARMRKCGRGFADWPVKNAAMKSKGGVKTSIQIEDLFLWFNTNSVRQTPRSWNYLPSWKYQQFSC